ncbi:MAG: PAS domain S-box protein [Proteobacteria bacterium]|nr:PAS domain S-box protein [Pseudomonadota bacterium]MBU1709797.1 PAS domain S-box protein [Pseudomonadota bacterium]
MSKEEYIREQLFGLTHYWSGVLLLLGAIIFLFLGVLDYLVTPENFQKFLLLRIAIAIFLVALYPLNSQLLKKDRETSRKINAAIIVICAAMSAAVIEIMILRLGGHRSPYYAGQCLMVIGLLGLLPLGFGLSLIIGLTVYSIYLVPILLFDTIQDIPVFINNNFFLLTTIIIAMFWRSLSQYNLINSLGLQYDLDEDKNKLEDYSDNLEQLVDARTRELNKSEIMLRELFEQANDGIVIMDKDGTIVNANKKACEMHGFPRDTLIGSNIRLLQRDKDDSLFAQRYRRILEGESCIFEARHITKQGNLISVEVSTRAIEVDGTVLIQSFHRDITDKKKMQNQLLHSQKMDSIGQLAGGISHDFKNILTSIITMTEVMLRMDNLDDFIGANLKIIEQAGRRGTQIVSKLLSFARRGVSESAALNCNNVIDDTCEMLSSLLPKSIKLIKQRQEPLPPIRGDATQLEQVLMNLILNGRDAMPKGGELRIKTDTTELTARDLDIDAAVKPGQYVHISVTDSGMGIPAENIERVFEPFFSTKEEGKGTGLGLAMVYGIIKEHEGYIAITSHPGKGTTFDIYIPVIAEEFSGTVAESQAESLDRIIKPLKERHEHSEYFQ